jgi:hypothetical protein
MNMRLMQLAVAAFGVALFTFPPAASAGVWETSTAGETISLSSSTPFGPTQGGVSSDIACTSTSGTGVYKNGGVASKTTGEQLTLTFKGCTETVFGTPCTTTGQVSGTIKTTDLTWHNIMLESTPTGVAGILITPNGTHFASYSCDFGAIQIEWRGNGLIGEVEQPCSTSGKTFTVNYESPTTGTQKWMQITTEGTKYDLDAKEIVFGGTPTVRTFSADGTSAVTFVNTQTISCP